MSVSARPPKTADAGAAPPAKSSWTDLRDIPSHRRPVCQLNGLRRASATAHARPLLPTPSPGSHQLSHPWTSAHAQSSRTPGSSPGQSAHSCLQAATAHVLRQPRVRLGRTRPRSAVHALYLASISPARRCGIMLSNDAEATSPGDSGRDSDGARHPPTGLSECYPPTPESIS
ncbi:hypothetical protein L226DRAFT_358202 [Lentinus tigrinus ALCF2SS1-7]|uniref:uncharacterized protein n=1 Tax=Lentinus tigrinus ALCF2SS1-7 TaxID=1328758 RepID=UPI001165F8A4|nr:hypothetical protein L226DRAFT_358202 [Lentinus tigrinus ALCF2SS1-7]